MQLLDGQNKLKFATLRLKAVTSIAQMASEIVSEISTIISCPAKKSDLNSNKYTKGPV